MKISPIRSKKDHARALKRVEQLMDATANSAEADELDILATLVDAYEEIHYPIGDPDPIVAIEHCMEARGMERKDLEPLLGSRSRVSEVLNRKRKLTMDMVRKLHDTLQIPASTLIQDYPLNP